MTRTGAGAKARVCPTSDGPASARTAPMPITRPATQSRARCRSRVRTTSAEPEDDQRGADQLVDHQRRASNPLSTVAELEALRVDRRDRHLQDRGRSGHPGGVRRQRGAAGPRASPPAHVRGSTRTTKSGEPGGEQEADVETARSGRRGARSPTGEELVRRRRRDDRRAGGADREGQRARDGVAVAGEDVPRHDVGAVGEVGRVRQVDA